MALLEVKSVIKRYGPVTAVDRVSFSARQGRILGLLGPNGAGKTSTIRMITYITLPDAGKVTIGGRLVGAKSQQLMGYLPEERGLYKKMKVGEQLIYLARLKGLTRSEAEKAARRWLDRFDAEDWFDRETSALSKGMQQKVQFIATLLHDPKLLIFDEPFSGLDPINADLLREIILELKEENRTILFASHRMEQVERLCDDICLMSDGRVVLSGTLRAIKRSADRDTVKLSFDGESLFVDRLAREEKIRIVERGPHHVELRLQNGTTGREVLHAALENTREVTRFELVEPSMSEIFKTTVNGSNNQEAAAAS